MTELQAVNRHRLSYIHHLIEWSQAQVEDWRKVPWLALQADGRSGYNAAYQRAYRHGLWALESSVGRYGGYSVYVDLDSGDLIAPHHLPKLIQASQADVLRVDPDEINAVKLVDQLREKGQEEYWKGYLDFEQDKWRDGIIDEENLEERYRRTKAPPTPTFELD